MTSVFEARLVPASVYCEMHIWSSDLEILRVLGEGEGVADESLCSVESQVLVKLFFTVGLDGWGMSGSITRSFLQIGIESE